MRAPEFHDDGTMTIFNDWGQSKHLTVDEAQAYWSWLVSKGKGEPDDPWNNEGNATAGSGMAIGDRH